MINSRLEILSKNNYNSSKPLQQSSHRRITSQTIPMQFAAEDFIKVNIHASDGSINAEKIFESAGIQVQENGCSSQIDEQEDRNVDSSLQNFRNKQKRSARVTGAAINYDEVTISRGLQKRQQRRVSGIKALAITCKNTVSGIESIGTQSSFHSTKMNAFSNKNLLAKPLPSTYKVSKEMNISKPKFSTQVVARPVQQRRQRPLTGNPRINQRRQQDLSPKAEAEQVTNLLVPNRRRHRRPFSNHNNTGKISSSNFSNPDFSLQRLAEAASGSILHSSQHQPSEVATIKHKRAISASTYKRGLLQPVRESTAISTMKESVGGQSNKIISYAAAAASPNLRKNETALISSCNIDKENVEVNFAVCTSRRAPIKSLALAKRHQASSKVPQARTFLPPEAKAKSQKLNESSKRHLSSTMAIQNKDIPLLNKVKAPESDNQDELLEQLVQQKKEAEEAGLETTHLHEVINMIKLKQVPKTCLYDWSQHNSKVVRRVRRSLQAHSQVLTLLNQQTRHFKMLSQKRTDLYKTRAELRELEMSGEIRKFILASDPQAIPDSFIEPEPVKSLNIKFFKAGKPNKLLKVKHDKWSTMGGHRRF